MTVLHIRDVYFSHDKNNLNSALVITWADQSVGFVTKEDGQGWRCGLITTDPPAQAGSVTIEKTARNGEKSELVRLSRITTAKTYKRKNPCMTRLFSIFKTDSASAF